MTTMNLSTWAPVTLSSTARRTGRHAAVTPGVGAHRRSGRLAALALRVGRAVLDVVMMDISVLVAPPRPCHAV